MSHPLRQKAQRAAIGLALAGLVTAVMVAAAPTAASAFPDAPVEAQDRPCWNLFPDPTVAVHCQPAGTSRPVQPTGPRVIDCDRARPGDVSRALQHLHSGATLYLVALTRPCVDSLTIDRPVTIAGRYGLVLNTKVPTLVSPAGHPCVVMTGKAVRVVLSGLIIQTETPGDNACIVQQGGDLRLEGDWVRYDGRGPAIASAGGRLTLSGSTIAARTTAVAVDVLGSLDLDNSAILAAVSGLSLSASADSSLRGSSIARLDDWTGTERARQSAGAAVTGAAGVLVQVDGLSVVGFSRGLGLSGGGEAAVQSLRIRDSDWAVVARGSHLRILGGELQASELGVYAAAGDLWLADLKIVGVMRAGIFVEKGARLKARDNTVFPHATGCDAMIGDLAPGTLTCRPWFEAPEFYRTGRAGSRLAYASAWPGAVGSGAGRDLDTSDGHINSEILP